MGQLKFTGGSNVQRGGGPGHLPEGHPDLDLGLGLGLVGLELVG